MDKLIIAMVTNELGWFSLARGKTWHCSTFIKLTVSCWLCHHKHYLLQLLPLTIVFYHLCVGCGLSELCASASDSFFTILALYKISCMYVCMYVNHK